MAKVSGLSAACGAAAWALLAACLAMALRVAVGWPPRLAALWLAAEAAYYLLFRARREKKCAWGVEWEGGGGGGRGGRHATGAAQLALAVRAAARGAALASGRAHPADSAPMGGCERESGTLSQRWGTDIPAP